MYINLPLNIKLNLNSWQRCIIESIKVDHNETVLNLKSESGCSKSKCSVQDQWRFLRFAVNDLLSVIAKWDDSKNQYCVTAYFGMIVQNPDYLISGTSVVGSLFCQRKGVLTDWFKGIDGGNKVVSSI